MEITLKPFQERALAKLRKQFLELWKTENRRLPLIFKSPTGSGKTVMMAQFLKDLTGDPQFDADKAFLWVSFSEDSYLQSKEKLYDYYDGAGEITLLDLNDLNRKKLEKNNVFFINWQKVKASTKEGRKLRRETERTEFDKGIFDEFIIRTQKEGEGRELILIIDEAHRDSDTELANEIYDLVDPRIFLRITATPQNIPNAEKVQNKEAGYVGVKKEEVVEAGLIKEKIVTQTKEDLDKVLKKEIDQDNLLLELAYNQRKNLIKHYKKIGTENINPLVLIQLPNDDKARKETLDKSKEEIVKEFLRAKGVKDHEIAVWLSEKKENLEEVEKNDSDINFLIFKQAAATGWDCPRAHILIMFREIKNPTFHTQTVGRILRMPEAKHYEIPELNIGYLYTNYARNQINMPDNGQGKNKAFIYQSKRKDEIKPIILESTHLSRVDYNDLGMNFQFTFEKVADKFFGIKDGFIGDNLKKIKSKGIETGKPEIPNKLIVDAEIEDYDNFVEEIKNKGEDLEKDISRNDLERTYNLLCFNILAHQEEENKKFAPERSWGRLKTALNVWFQKRITPKREEYYRVIVKDLLKDDSILRQVVSEALQEHKPIRAKEVKEKEAKKESHPQLEIPREILFFTDDYEEISELNQTTLDSGKVIKLSKNAMQPFYLLKSYRGKENETTFIRFLEQKDSVDWWYKNGDSGSENFAVKYFDEDQNKDSLFYPDWIIKLNNGKLYILDTKKGMTAKDNDTKLKAEALQKWIKNSGQKNIIGGIVANVSSIWKINKNKTYKWDQNYSEWENLEL
ncbi:MAG: DEAD/DEAH box helicase [Promethearchaeota archaeon]